jgi:hypothetical protein
MLGAAFPRYSATLLFRALFFTPFGQNRVFLFAAKSSIQPTATTARPINGQTMRKTRISYVESSAAVAPALCMNGSS